MAQMQLCPRCHRPMFFPVTTHHGPCETGITAYIVHAGYRGYGCGCGHLAYLLDATGAIVASHLSWSHPSRGNLKDFIREQIHSRWPWATIDQAKCEVIDD
jgi:hypothetical protein